MNNIHELFSAKVRFDLSRLEDRVLVLKRCTDDVQRQNLKDKWDADDRIKMIVDAIRDVNRSIVESRRGFLGIF